MQTLWVKGGGQLEAGWGLRAASWGPGGRQCGEPGRAARPGGPGLTGQDEVQQLDGCLEAGAGDAALVGVQGQEAQRAEEGGEAGAHGEAAGHVVAVEDAVELRRVRLVLEAVGQHRREDDEREDLWVREGCLGSGAEFGVSPNPSVLLGSPPVGAARPCTHGVALAPPTLSGPQSLPARPSCRPSPVFPTLAPASSSPPGLRPGLLPSLPTSSLRLSAHPHLAPAAHSHLWLPGGPRTEAQPLGLAFEALRDLCSLQLPASPTLPFRHRKLVPATKHRYQDKVLRTVPSTHDELRMYLPERCFYRTPSSSLSLQPLPPPCQLG